MPNLSQLESVLRQVDRILVRSEDLAVKAIQRTVRGRLRELEDRLRRLDEQSRDVRRISDVSKREARARLLVAQLEGALQAFDLGQVGTGVPQAIQRAIVKGQETGIEMAESLLAKFDEPVPIRGSVDLEAVAAAVENVKARLSKHGAELQQAAEDLVVQGLVQGQGPRKLAAALRDQTGILLWQAERILRTETIHAQDASSRATYQRNGVEFVQILATLDVRVCGYCAARHGNVYKVEDCPIPQHPGCRDAAMPWRKEWLDSGLINVEELQNSKATVLARLQEKLRHGQTPAEKFAGKDTALPVWKVPPGGVAAPEKEKKGRTERPAARPQTQKPNEKPVTVQEKDRRPGFSVPEPPAAAFEKLKANLASGLSDSRLRYDKSAESYRAGTLALQERKYLDRTADKTATDVALAQAPIRLEATQGKVGIDLTDGRHRWLAARLHGAEQIRADVRFFRPAGENFEEVGQDTITLGIESLSAAELAKLEALAEELYRAANETRPA